MSITNENMRTMLHHALTKKQNTFIAVNDVDTEISPEMIYLAISSNYGLPGYRPYETTVFSEWMVRMSPRSPGTAQTHMVEIKPVNIHTNHLYTVNLAKFWPYVTRTRVSDGWFRLPSFPLIQLEDIVLNEHAISIRATL